ncbi:hypothetical protein TWF718_008203 [Orbilia javanica]
MGKNEGRQFWTCSKSSGPRAGCGFWIWIEEARDRERAALMVNGKVPSHKVTPSRRMTQPRITDSFRRKEKAVDGSSVKKKPRLEGKGKAPAVRFENQGSDSLHSTAEADVISVPSDADNSVGDGSSNHSDGDSDGDSKFEDARYAFEASEDYEPDHIGGLDQDDNPFESSRKIPRTENNSSPSKHLLEEASSMIPSTESTVADNPPRAYQQDIIQPVPSSDLVSRTSSGQERYARKQYYDNVTPVKGPNFPGLQRSDASSALRPTTSAPRHTASTQGHGNPFAPDSDAPSQQMPNGTYGQGVSLGTSSASAVPRHGGLLVEGGVVSNGSTDLLTPQRYMGAPMTPNSNVVDNPLDVTDEVFKVLNRSGVSLSKDDTLEIKRLLEKSFKKQYGFYISRNMARNKYGQRSQMSHNEDAMPLTTPSQSFVAETQPPSSPSPSYPSLSTSYLSPLPPHLTPRKTLPPPHNTEDSMLNEIKRLRRDVDSFKKRADLAEMRNESLKDEKNKSSRLQKEIVELKMEIERLNSMIGEGSADGEGEPA